MVKVVLVEMLIILAGSVLAGVLVSKEIASERYMVIYASIILFVASFLGSKSLSARQQNEKIMLSVLCTVTLLILLLMSTILLFDCQYGNIGMQITGLAIGSIVSYVFSIKKANTKRFKTNTNRRLYKMHNG